MKKRILRFALLFFLSGLVFSNYSCSKKMGCAINDKAQAKADKNGKFKKQKTRSGLFPKGMGK